MVSGFAGFGFPKAHSAAFGLLAYQSSWLRVHYGPEFLCALLNEQPMGFYPPDSLAHEAQRRGIELRAVEINASRAECTLEPDQAVRVGLGYVRGVHADEVAQLVAARESQGPFSSLSELLARVPAARPSLEQLAWSGACDALAGGRREALWELGVGLGARHTPGGTQLALALNAGLLPALPPLGRWERLLANYATSGMTLDDHALAILRPRLARRHHERELERERHGSEVAVAGIVVARQRPETASGVVFMLVEDEHGTINLIVPPALYERRRHIVRAEPLVLARGRLERPPAGGGTINVLVRELRTLDDELLPGRGAGRTPSAAASPARAPAPRNGGARSIRRPSSATPPATCARSHRPSRASLRDGGAKSEAVFDRLPRAVGHEQQQREQHEVHHDRRSAVGDERKRHPRQRDQVRDAADDHEDL